MEKSQLMSNKADFEKVFQESISATFRRGILARCTARLPRVLHF